MTWCPICMRRRTANDDDVCRTCRLFIVEVIDTGMIKPQAVPAVADVLLVMERLGVRQDRAVIILAGTP